MDSPFDRFNPNELSKFASEVVARADAQVAGFSNLGVASLLMDELAWSRVSDYLVARGRTLHKADVLDPVLCDLQTHAHRDHVLNGLSGLEGHHTFLARAALRRGLQPMATTLREMANKDAHSCNLRDALRTPGVPKMVAQLGIVGWSALIQKKTNVVLPLFEHANNGRVAAATINQIARVDPDVTVSISGGPAQAKGHLIVDLMGLRSDRVPGVTIRIKETLGIQKVTVLAPPHVSITLERDGSTAYVVNAHAPGAIESMVLERSVHGGPFVKEDLHFGKPALPLPPLAPLILHNFAALADAQPLMEETAVAASGHEPSSEGKRD
ncbi:MAG: hypothetical protein H7332_15505 [Bdellovibrionales bacterium]|nr:hypothetical protein [Ramlibacter sp.]